MPQNCQIIGVNSVTNIEPGKGVMPAPIIRNADWLEIFACMTCSAKVSSASTHALRCMLSSYAWLLLTFTG